VPSPAREAAAGPEGLQHEEPCAGAGLLAGGAGVVTAPATSRACEGPVGCRLREKRRLAGGATARNGSVTGGRGGQARGWRGFSRVPAGSALQLTPPGARSYGSKRSVRVACLIFAALGVNQTEGKNRTDVSWDVGCRPACWQRRAWGCVCTDKGITTAKPRNAERLSHFCKRANRRSVVRG